MPAPISIKATKFLRSHSSPEKRQTLIIFKEIGTNVYFHIQMKKTQPCSSWNVLAENFPQVINFKWNCPKIAVAGAVTAS